MPTSTVAITLDLGCCRCRSQIQKILCCLQERCGFVFDKVVYDKDKVLVSGPFDAIDLCCKLRCKAGCFAKNIEIVPPPPPPVKPPPPPPPVVEPEPAPCKALIPYPCPYPYPYPCSSPCSNPQPTCTSSCAIPRTCQCHSCRPPPPPCPTPPPPCPPPPVCNKCPIWTPCQCRGYPWVVCAENLPPDGPCAVM